MLESKHLKNVGPAAEMKMDLAPRLNVIPGDNSLRKSFLIGSGTSHFDLAHLVVRAPFIASELRRHRQLVRGDV